MYCDYFGLRCRPFEDHADPQFCLATADCEKALAALESEAHQDSGMALLVAEAGVGKTILLRALVTQLDPSDRAVVLTRPPDGQMNLIRETAKGFGVVLPASHQSARCLSRLRRHLTRALRLNHRANLIVDQAENLTSLNMVQLVTLAKLQHNGRKLLNITLAGRPPICSLLGQSAFRRHAQRPYETRILSPLSLAETAQYVAHRLRIAGAADVNVFDAEAVELIHKDSKGIPRAINQMCHAAMLAAYEISREMSAEAATATTLRERSADARDVGVVTVEQVAAGLTTNDQPSAAVGRVAAEVTGVSHAHLADGPTEVGAASADQGLASSPVLGRGTSPASAAAVDDPPVFGEPTAESELSYAAMDQGGDGDDVTDAYVHKTGVSPSESTCDPREELLNRLDRTLARADRTNASIEVSLQQFTAVKRHFASLVVGGERLVDRLEQRVRHTAKALDDMQNRLEDTLKLTEDRRHSSEAETTRASEIATAVRQHAEGVEAARACAHDVDALIARAQAVEAGLSNVVPRGEKLLLEVQTTCGRLEATQRSAATMLLEIGGASECLSALREQVSECQDAAARLAAGRTESARTTEHLEDTANSARQLLPTLQRACTSAAQEGGRLDALCALTNQTLENLSHANAAAQPVIEQVHEKTRMADEAAEKAGARLTNLATANGTAEAGARLLDELLTSSHQIHEALQGVIAHADDKIGRLDSHNASAANVLHNLSEANVAGHGLVERVHESKQALEETVDGQMGQIEKALQEVSALTMQTELKAKTLVEHNVRAGDLIDKLDSTTGPAVKISAELGQRLDQAEKQVTGIKERCDQGSKLAERLDTVTSLLKEMQACEASVKQTTEDAQHAHEQLLDAADNAHARNDALEELNASSRERIETYEQMQREAETTAERLAAQVLASQRCLKVGGPLINRFMTEAKAIQQQYRDMQGQATQIEHTIADAMARPTEIAAGAQAQAAELERVCEAVQKVFNGLSEATQEAGKRSAECVDVTRHAAQRLSELTIGTDRAAHTLHEWVEEAVRAQSRLERSLQTCPSVRETHPAETIRRVPAGPIPVPHIANPSASESPALLSDPPPATEAHGREEVTNPPTRQETGRPPTRAQAISKLIEDAKRVVSRTKT